ncbi:MAG: hypothetical protein Kow0010_13040 [Dehalococcoidia bacterium]
MNCEEVRELAGAYVLGALESGELEAFEAHVAGCAEHGDLLELEATVAALALGAEEREPPAGLLERVRAGIVAEPARGDRLVAAPAERRWLRWGSIAAAVLVGVALLAWNLALQFGGGDAAPEYVHTYHGRGTVWMRLEGRMSEAPVTVEVGGLDQLATGQVYRLWAIRDDAWIAIGEFNTNDEGWWRGEFEFSVRRGDVLSVTVEPAGSDGRPTGEPLFRTEL